MYVDTAIVYDDLFAAVSFGGGGSDSGGSSSHSPSSSSGTRTNRAAKGDRGDAPRTIGNTAAHIGSNIGVTLGHDKNGGKVSVTPNCGSCHDPYKD